MRRTGGVVLGLLLIGTTGSTQLNNRIITTVAGGGPDQVHISTTAMGAQSLFFDGAGNLWLSNERVYRIDPTGIITLRAGGSEGFFYFDGDGGLGVEAGLSAYGAALDGAGNLMIADFSNQRIRRVVAATGLIETVAGTGVRTGYIDGEGGEPADDLGDGGPAVLASVRLPSSVAIDPADSIVFSDTYNHRIRRIDAATGIITTIVGTGVEGFNGDDIDAASASLSYPVEIQYDAHGNLFIADAVNNRIRRVDAVTGLISTVAGNGQATGSLDGEGGDPSDDLSDGVPATFATVQYPYGVRLDAAGNIYIADAGNNRIRRVDAFSGIITTVAGNGLPTGYIDGPGGDPEDDLTDGVAATSTTLYSPLSVAIDSGDNLIIADSQNYRIRRVDSSTGIITSISGDPDIIHGDGELATRVRMSTKSVAFGPGGDLFVGSFNSVRRVDPGTARLSTVAGCTDPGNCSAGDGGPATQFPVNVTGLAFGPEGDLYVASGFGNQVLRVDSVTQTISAVAGNGIAGVSGDGGPATQAAVGVPVALAFDSAGNLYIAQNGDNRIWDPFEVRIRRVDATTGLITTVAGGYPYSPGNGDGGPATLESFYSLAGLAVDAAGNIFISEYYGSRVRRVDAATGLINTLAGTGEFGYGGDGGPSTAAMLSAPDGLTVDADGGLLIADSGNNRIRRVDLSTGIISTVAGNGEIGFRGDGGDPTEARLALPSGVASLPNGDIAIADYWNSRVRLIATEGTPPVADAGADFSVACTAADGTTVMLDGSASTGPAGATLSYAWTGVFPEGGGIVAGVNPMVTLPLGRSESSLVVSDGRLDSAPDTVEVVVMVTPRGLSAPLANLAPVGETPPLPPGSFKRGSTLPLKLQLMCGQERQTDQDVAAPRVVGLARDGVSVPLSLVQVDRGSGDPAVLIFRSVSGGSWVFNMRTSALQRGTYAVTVEMPDGRRFVAGFVLS